MNFKPPVRALLCLFTLPLAAQSAPAAAPAPAEQPLSALPYAPSLDPAAMDRTADPCKDLYQYSCGGWKTANPIPADKPEWSVYSKLEEDNQRYLWGLLEAAARGGAERPADTRKLGDFFGACMDEAAIEAAGAAPLQPALAEIAALKSPRELPGLLARRQLEGSGALFGFGSEPDAQHSDMTIAGIGAAGLGLPDRDYYLKADAKSRELRVKYRGHLEQMFALLGDDAAAARREAAAVLRIETALARATLSNVDRRDPYKTFHKFTRAKLAALAPGFGWDDYFGAFPAAPAFESLDVDQPAFFKAAGGLVRTVPVADWRAYLRWHTAHGAAAHLSRAFQELNFDFYGRTLRGTKVMSPRWKRCTRLIDNVMGEALGRLFVEKTFSPDTKARALEMTRLVETAMGERLRQLDWMSPATRARALEKLATVRNKIGYPDKWRDYSALRIERAGYYDDVQRTGRFETDRQLVKIGKPVDRDEWDISAPTVNAFYSALKNDINFPAGVLQPPLFDPKTDDAPNYGNTGATIGHELTHGFDDEGRQYDAKGNLANWWAPADDAEFKRRSSCVVEQYGQYVVVDDVKLTSKLTLGEDIADLGGELLAWDAWKQATAGKTLQPADGLTPEQRFFVGFAQWACENSRPEYLRLMAATNPHSPGWARINGVAVNMPQFAPAFNCPAGSPLVKPAEKVCRIW
jgi:putative endopeptidase